MRSSSALLLAIDTSTRTVGLALYDGARVISESTWQSVDYHTVELAPAVQEALRRANLTAEDIDAIGVATGPGSFTGLRIGLALAKGIALSRRIPLIGIPSLDILAAAQPISTRTLICILRLGRGRLALGWYEAQQETWQPSKNVETCTPDELAERVPMLAYLCGELNSDELELLRQLRPDLKLASPSQALRRPGFLAELAWKRWKSGQSDDPASLAPSYLHYKESIPE